MSRFAVGAYTPDRRRRTRPVRDTEKSPYLPLFFHQSIDRKDVAISEQRGFLVFGEASLAKEQVLQKPCDWSLSKRSQKPKRPLAPEFGSSLQLCWKCSNISTHELAQSLLEEADRPAQRGTQDLQKSVRAMAPVLRQCAEQPAKHSPHCHQESLALHLKTREI